MQLENYLNDIEYIDEPDFDAGFLFKSIDFRRGYAIPTDAYWEAWHENRAKVVQAGLIPRKIGHSLGVSSAWVVRLPIHPQTGGTEHVSEVVTRCMLSFISEKII